MYIDPKSKIAGCPALTVRKFFRVVGESSFSARSIQDRFSVSPQKANAILREFLAAGLIEKADSFENEPRWWKTTTKGNTLALASAAIPLKRETATRIVREFVERVRKVNSDSYYLYRVTKVIVFGSYLSSKDRLNDIDIALALAPKHSDRNLQASLEEKRRLSSGRKFSNFLDQLLWPRHEVALFLKSRSRAISLHDAEIHSPILRQEEILAICDNDNWLEG